MKKLLFLVFVITIVTRTWSQGPTFEGPLSNSAGTTQNSITAISTDGFGNIYFGGGHTDTLRFGGSSLLPGQGGAFFGKATAAGTVLWLYQGGTSNPTFDKAYDVAVDGNGDVYFCGAIPGFLTASFNGTPLPSTFSGFVVKYSSTGTFRWAHGYGGAVYAIAIDSNNTPVISVNDQYVTKIDPANGAEPISNTYYSGSLQNPQYHNIVIDSENNVIVQGGNKIVKYDPALTQLWSTPVTASLMETFRITIDDSNNVYGSFYGLFGSITIGGITKTSFPNGYMYKLDRETGTPLFVDSILFASAASKIRGIIVNSLGEYYLSGDGAFNVPHVAKLAADKSTIWEKSLSSAAKVNDFEMNANDCLVLAGTHSQNAVFDSYTLVMPNGISSVDNSYLISLCGGTVDVQEFPPDGTIPERFSLLQNHPNPFNPKTDLQFTIANLQFVTLQVFDILGREVVSLVNETLQPGTYKTSWDASNKPSGMYFYRLQAGNYSETKKMMLIK